VARKRNLFSRPCGTLNALRRIPALKRWVGPARQPSPEGTAEGTGVARKRNLFSRPCGTLNALRRIPALKRWAIFNHPSGMQRSKSQWHCRPTKMSGLSVLSPAEAVGDGPIDEEG